jgi:hypothetical protein
MKGSPVVLGVWVTAALAASLTTQKSEESRVMIAALEQVKATQTGPFLLSPAKGGPARETHDSLLLAEISSVALRVAALSPPYVLDTFVLSVQPPMKTAEGTYTVRAGGSLATVRNGQCRIGGPSNTYTVRCVAAECKAELTAQRTGSGRCDG